MSISNNPLLLNQSISSKPLRLVCYDASRVNSEGIFLGDKPLLFSVPLLLLELILMFLATNAIHCLLKRFGQCRFVSHLITGILLGPSVMGRTLLFEWTLFPERGTIILDILAHFGLIFFLFDVGVKTDLRLLGKLGRGVVAISIVSSLVPIVLSLVAFFAFRSAFPQELSEGPFVSQVILRLSLSSFPVVVDALDELQLLNSALGRIAVSAALLEDMVNLVVGVIMAIVIMASKVETVGGAIGIVASVLGFFMLVVFVARPAARWTARQTPKGEMLTEWHFVGLLLMALVASLMTTSIGFNMTLGPLMLGLAVPGGMPVGVTLTERLQPLCMGLFLPLYLLLLGYRTNLEVIDNVRMWVMLELLVFVCYFGKLAGTVAGSRYFNMSMKDAIIVGLMLNIKGILEIFIFIFFIDINMASPDHLPALTLSMLLMTAGTTPIIKMLYNPMMRYVVLKQRTIEHMQPNADLHLLACVHSEDHVTPLLGLLEASHATLDSPISLTVLHLNELTGRSAPVLRPHKRDNSRYSLAATTSDRIMNAFRYFEQQQSQLGVVTIQTFVAIAPYCTMHNDICSLALEQKACLVLLPFHKHFNGARETANLTIQSLNCNVLNFAPCSVAILIEHTLPDGAATYAYTNRLLHHVAIYFFGGPDDREALAFASRMANKRSVTLTIVRFVHLQDNAVTDEDEERKLDDMMVEQVQDRYAGNERLVYMEMVVKDGEDTIEVIHRMSEEFDLVIVGRRNGMQSTLTSGLSDWSECPELGIIGDMLAMEFGDKVSILVVQQHRNFEEAGRVENTGGGSGSGGGRMSLRENNVGNTFETKMDSDGDV